MAKVWAAPSGLPRTEHPGLDLHVQDGATSSVVRIDFGDCGDGKNSCLPFNEMMGVRELPGAYPVQPWRARALLTYLKERNYCVGKFTSWGMPCLPSPSAGSNCGDAFLQVIQRLGIAPAALPNMRQWIKANSAGKWAFDRGRRRPVDEFFRETVRAGLETNQARTTTTTPE